MISLKRNTAEQLGKTRARFKNWGLKNQMYFGSITLMIVVALLAVAGIQGVLNFRALTKNIRHRATELPLTADLNQRVSDLRVSYALLASYQDKQNYLSGLRKDRLWLIDDFKHNIGLVKSALQKYEIQLDTALEIDSHIHDITNEKATVVKLRDDLREIDRITHQCDLVFHNSHQHMEIEELLEDLQYEVQLLPTFMKNRMDSFAEVARSKYHAWLAFSIILVTVAFVLIVFLWVLFRKWIFKPLGTLIAGSRQVASGNYDFRIKLETQDEVAELADALNAMTANFQAIQTELRDKVRQRSKEVIRSDQMASVGFLAAGVAHEINNPLAAIAWSAESLEMRIHEILAQLDGPLESNGDVDEMKKYLRRIQDEAFRCKGITSSLLDFSRLGEATKRPTELVEIVQGVIDMVRPLSKYRRKKIHFEHDTTVVANVIGHEMKQVILNLLTNALDSVEEQGHVHIQLRSNSAMTQLTVTDDGCGMTDEVMEHLFEPFFTRRNDGKGTGLGLSITYRIIDEHGGTIEPFSEGSGKGSTFVVKLPMVKNDEITRKAA